MQVAMGLLRAMRPKQWIKNFLVIAVPYAAGTLFHRSVLAACAIAFIAFTCAASSIYLLNDVRDIKADQQHPDKQHRPLASGQVPRVVAIVAASILAVVGLFLPFVLKSGEVSGDLVAVIGTYLVLQILYVYYLKNQPVLDIATVASGYVLRAVAGGVAASIFVSPWFLAVTGSGAVFMVAGKRYSELVTHGQSGNSRPILREYSPEYLRSVWSVAAGVTIVFYALWAFSFSGHSASAQLSIIPLTLALMRYGRDIDSASAEAPETAVFSDPWLIGLGIAFIVLFSFHLGVG